MVTSADCNTLGNVVVIFFHLKTKTGGEFSNNLINNNGSLLLVQVPSDGEETHGS